MKLKEYFYLFGLKPKEKKYGYQVKQFNLKSFGLVEYAQWKHPAESEKYIRENDVAYLKTFLDDGDFCIDIGAHSGDTAVPMALAVGKSGSVLALEPNPFVFPVLNKNTNLNKNQTNIIPLMIAATEKDGDIEFEYSDSGFCNGGRHENISKWKHGHAFNLTVTGLNLSSLLHDKYSEKLPNLKFIKVDAEGYDLSILKSISDIIEEYKPFVKTEIFKKTDVAYREAMFSFFSERRYRLYKVENDTNYKEKELSEADMIKWSHYDIFCVPNKVR
ncbi:hypothetical protein MNBD_IGNAVI01-455 [hydrothermal vent metagenome]|uniref:Methyltransferase FkbM domain-containing protein n=1 Tax=hydrothermal vent metagenome TaxID=652676 RepID=A0A3B1CBB1_9ZZZZ